MRVRTIGVFLAIVSVTGAAMAQGPESAQPVGTMAELMTSMTYPAANEILLVTHRGGPQDDAEWQAVRRAAVVLAESGNVMMLRGRAMDQGNWIKAAARLVEVGSTAYRAARAKDGSALVAVSEPLYTSCVACHTQYRPNVHPRR